MRKVEVRECRVAKRGGWAERARVALNSGFWNGGRRKVIRRKWGGDRSTICCHLRRTLFNHRFHSESSILTTLFGLLFWPILYKDISGAFETPYQLAPLDLGDDSFYQSRREDIEERLDRMTKKGETLKMLREVDERERERGTLAIGVKWAYERVDLEEIVQVSGLPFKPMLLR